MKYFLLFLFVIVSYHSGAQNRENYSNKFLPKKDSAGGSSTINIDSVGFCKTLLRFLREADENFVHIKGKATDTNASAWIYSANKGLPGAITSSIIDDGGWSYEGVLYEGSSKEKMEHTYATYKILLDGCMIPAGYDNTIEKHADEKYPHITYLKPAGGSNGVVLSIGYSDINSFYTVTISVNK